MDPPPEKVASPPAGALSPEDLMAAVARQPEALGRFFDHYVDRVFGLAYRMLGDRTAAEDVSQEVFLKIHRAIDRLDPQRDPGPWVTTITCNACREHWRGAQQKMRQKSVPLDEIADWQDAHPRSGDSPEEDVLRGERNTKVQDALMKLPDTLREVVILHDWQGLRHREIAEMLETSHAAVRKRYSRALEALAGLLGERP
ncbi:MAG TPA: RNA polymerase sigma factor [bacterium]|nr:RNA polymerase sigma factor [bacterium]